MQVSIRTNYRIVRAKRGKETFFVPQYQEEGDSHNTFHNFRAFKNEMAGEDNDIYFSNLEDAIICVEANRALEDKVVWRGKTDNY